MEMCGRVWEWERDATRSAARADRFLAWLFSDCSPAFLTVSFFLSFFLFFWDWEVSVSFSCLTSLFVCARARAFLFCSGWLLEFPAPFSLLSICHRQYTSMTSADCRVISSSHVQFDEMKVRLWRSYVRIQASDGFKSAFEEAPLEGSKPTAHRSHDVGGREAGIHAHGWKQQEAPLPHCRFEKSRQASPSLWTDKAKSPCACRFASTSSDHSISDGETELSRNSPRRHSHREQKRSGDRILGWTAAPSLYKKGRTATIWSGKKVRRNNESHLLVMPGCWGGCWRFAKIAIEERCGPRPRAWACYGTPWQQDGRLIRTWVHHVERRRKSSLERRRPSLFWKKITPGMSDSFETWQEYFWTIDASFKREKED